MDHWLSVISPCLGLPPQGFAGKSLCGHARHVAGWVEARRVIYDHELILVRDGVFEIEIEGTVHRCGADSWLIVPPGRWHTTSCLQPGVRHYAHFDWEHHPAGDARPVMTFFPAAPRQQFLRPAPQFVPQGILYGAIHEPAHVCALMDRLDLVMRGPNAHEQLAARGVLLELLIRLLDPHPAPTDLQHRREALAQQVRLALDRLVAAPCGDSAVCATLAAMGYSYEHLARVFRSEYGVSPIAYLHGIRVERAKNLLRHSKLTVAAIAEAVGYQDSVYFTRLFKRHCGTTPGKFRTG